MMKNLRLAVLALALPLVAHAQPSKEASQHFQRGLKLFDEQDFRAALIEFRRANELVPNPNVFYNIGQSCYQLQDYVCALQAFERYLAENGAKTPDNRRKEAETEINELRGRVAYFILTTNPTGAEISIDDTVIGKTPFASPPLVSAGRRKITATLEGRPLLTRTLDVAGGDRLKIDLKFPEPTTATTSSAPLAPVTSAPTTAPPPSNPPAQTPIAAYTAFGIGATGVLVGSIFGLMAVSSRSSLDDVCNAKKCPPSASSDLDALKRNSTVSTVGFVVGAVGAGVGTVLLLSPSKSGTEAKRSVHPWLGLGSAGLSGRF